MGDRTSFSSNYPCSRSQAPALVSPGQRTKTEESLIKAELQVESSLSSYIGPPLTNVKLTILVEFCSNMFVCGTFVGFSNG